jgi:uncharacterized protein YciI
MPLWVRMLLFTGPPDDVRATAGRQRDQLEELRSQGRLRGTFEFAPGDGRIDIFEAEDRLAAEAIVHDSPLVADGLASWILKEIGVKS